MRSRARPAPRAKAVARGARLLSLVAALCVHLLVVLPSGIAVAQAPGTVERAPAPAPIALESSPDPAIAARLQAIFRNYEGLGEIDVTSSGGVVTLAGEAASPADRERATALARRVAGVVEVRNELNVGDEVGAQAVRIYNRLAGRITEYLLYMPVVALAACVLLAFWLVARWTAAKAQQHRRFGHNYFIRQVSSQTLRLLIVLLGLVVALEILEATSLIGAVLGAAGLTGLVVGFALKETVENYVAGVLLSLRQPFDPHDHVLIENHEGRVVRLTSRATVLLSLDGNHVRIPNATVFKGVIINFTRNPERRFRFAVGVAPNADLAEAQRLATELLEGTDGVLGNPRPEAWVEDIGASSIALTVVGWVDQREHAFQKVRGEAIRRLVEGFFEAGIEMPEPIYRIILPSAEPHSVPERLRTRQARGAAPDLARDSYLDREIADERARMSGDDLLDPAAAKE